MILVQLSFWYEFTPVPSCGSVFIYMIRVHVPAQNLVPERVIPVRVHPGHCTGARFSLKVHVRKLVPMLCKLGMTAHSGMKSLSRGSGMGGACMCLFNHTSADI